MRTRILLLTLLCALTAKAQLPTDFRTEQIYLNPEKHSYLPGDTIPIEGMVTCITGERFFPHSNYLYIECINENDSVLLRQKISCKDKGFFSTYLPTDYEWSAGVYYLRAYTQLMRNFSPRSFAQQPFLLGKEFPKKEEQAYEVQCAIIPSGGRLVANNPQTVAVHLTDECTFPISSPLLLKNEFGDTIASVRTSLSGMASLRFIPRDSIRYHLEVHIDGKEHRFPLPDISSKTKIQGILNGKRLSYQILNGNNNRSYHLYTFDRHNGLTHTETTRSNGILMMNQTPEVLTLFLMDENNQIISEYTVAGKQKREMVLQAPTTIEVNETICYELSSLTNATRIMVRIAEDNDLLTTNAENVLKYQTDYTSPLPFPRYLSAEDEVDYNNDLHTWLSTARFHRFDLKEVVEKDTTLYTYFPEEVMTFSGKIEKKTKRPLKGGQLVAYHTINDFVYDVPLVSDSARFLMAVDDFMDGEEFFLQAITAKEKPDFANYHIDDETFPSPVNDRRFQLPTSRYAETEVTTGNTFNLEYTVGKDKIRNYTLPNVTVKARLKTEEAKPTHEFYSTNYADREKIEERAFGTLYDILRDMPGIRVTYDPFVPASRGESRMTNYISGQSSGNAGQKESSYTISSTRGVSAFRSSGIPIIIDNVKFTAADYDYILNMSAFEIESVQLLRAWQTLAYTNGAIDGAILVKTRAYKDRPPLPSKGAIYKPTGLSPLSYPFKVYESRSQIVANPGNYRLIVDVFTDKEIRSYEHRFEVVEDKDM